MKWTKILQKSQPASEDIRALREAIAGQIKTGVTWVGRFVQNGGLHALVTIGSQNKYVSRQPFVSPAEWVVLCHTRYKMILLREALVR